MTNLVGLPTGSGPVRFASRTMAASRSPAPAQPSAAPSFQTCSPRRTGPSNKYVVLQSTDGINWSRDDVSSIAGHDVSMINRTQLTDKGLLVTAVDNSQKDAKGIPKTLVLVGTPKS